MAVPYRSYNDMMADHASMRRRDEDPTRDIRLLKPGPLAIERHQRKLGLAAQERAVKMEVRSRDAHRCRWPHCAYRAVSQPLDCAHLDPSGMGGDPLLERMTTGNLILLCRLHHKALDANDTIAIQPQDADRGADGPCDFLVRTDAGHMEIAHAETIVGVSVTRSTYR